MKTNNKLQYKAFAGAIAILALFYASATSAITASEFSIPTQIPDLEEQIDIAIEPKFPKPGETVKLTLEAFGIDLNTSSISWSINGKSSLSGKGQKSVSFVAGKSGQATNVEVKIAPTNSKGITRAFTVSPQTVDIIWEARTYTPPFYRGKALYSPQENVKFVAMPYAVGRTANPDVVAYKWSQDYEVQGSKSGVGAQSFAYKGGILMLPVNILVSATDQNGNVAENYLALAPFSPQIGLYEESPLYGILWNNELSGGFNFGDKEERTVAAYPYHFGASGKASANLSYSWAINGYEISVPTSQGSMTFRNTKGEEGKSIIGVAIKNNGNFLESAESGTTINFEKPRTGFSF